MSQIGITIESINFNGESVDITFNPYSGGSINLGTQTIPYDYLSSNYEGNYTIDIPSIPKTCTLQIGTPPSPTPTPSVTVTPTMTPTPTPTPPPAGDPDANAYLADVVSAGGTTDATIDAAVDTLFVDLKAAGVYSKLVAFYPLVGGVASSNLINANGNTSYDLTLSGGWVHNTDGMVSNGTNTIGDTSIIPATTLSATDNHTSVFFKDLNGPPGYDGAGPAPYLIHTVGRSLEVFNGSAHMPALGSVPVNGKCFLINVKENNTSAFAATNVNGVGYSVKATNTNAATALPTVNWYIGKINGLGGWQSQSQYWFVTLGNGLTQTQASDLHDAIDTFATTLGRT